MTRSQNYHLKMPREAYDALQAIADQEGRLLADVIREALQEYTARKGYTVGFKVTRGGNRRGKPQASEDEE